MWRFQWSTYPKMNPWHPLSLKRLKIDTCTSKKWTTPKCTLWLSSGRALGWFYLVLIAGAWLARKQFLRAGERTWCVCTHSLSPPPLSWESGRKKVRDVVRAGWKDLFGASIRAEAAIWRSQHLSSWKGHSKVTRQAKQADQKCLAAALLWSTPSRPYCTAISPAPDPSEVFAFSKQTLMSTRCLSRAKNMSETCASDAISPATRPCPNFEQRESGDRNFGLVHT